MPNYIDSSLLGDEKMYYTIGEIANYIGVNTSLIRFWEKQFPQIIADRNSKGNRIYTKQKFETIITIYNLVKVKGMTLPGAKKIISNPDELNLKSKTIKVVKRLKEIKTELEDLIK
jgi:DNA-binding transcriptional MerR regulator